MPGRKFYYANGQKVFLEEVGDEVAVRYREVNSVRRGLVSLDFGQALGTFERVDEVPDGRLTILRSKDKREGSDILKTLKEFDEVTYVTPVFRRPESGEKVVLTSKFICQFKPEVSRAEIDEMNARYRVYIESEEPYAPNCFVLRMMDDAAESMLDVANAYQESGKVLFAHPDLITRRNWRVRDSLFPSQWHLKNTGQSGGTAGADINVEDAWQLTEGRPDVVIAIVDDGVDTNHPEFSAQGKVVAPIDIRSGLPDARPRSGGENHGTAVSGVAAASRQGLGVVGVAPGCRILPIRLDGGPIFEARAIAYAAQNGAWVINCSWGPEDGDWWDPSDPTHNQAVPLPDNVRAAVDYAATQGRGGRGCVITWAAGNGNESVSNDGYASYSKVVAVAASSHDDKKATYSDYGPEISVAAPSNDFAVGGEFGGIWTTDRQGPEGYNDGDPAKGDAAGLYTNSFGGTSSAAPVVAGVAALVLSVNPTLTAAEVKRLMEDTGDRIDPQGGRWTPGPDGRLRSPFYGYGRVNAYKAVQEALRRPGAVVTPAPSPLPQVASNPTSVPIREFPAPAAASEIMVGQPGAIIDLAVSINVEHTWIGDLLVSLLAPTGDLVVLHNRGGGGTQHLVQTYDLRTTDLLRSLVGKSARGIWTLRVQDLAPRDIGRIVSWELRFALARDGAEGDIAAAESRDAYAIPDKDPRGVSSDLELAGAGTVADIRVDIDITHTYVGDISVLLVTPSGNRLTLRRRTGGSADNIIRSFTPANTASLAAFVSVGEPVAGRWTLVVSDRASFDIGKLNRWGIWIRRRLS